jgi:hypothetical membrane protein
MKPVSKVAFIAAIIGPIQSAAGWLIAGALWPSYNPVSQTISDLAAPESPVHTVMSSFFVLGGTLTLIAGLFGRTLAMPGRVVLFITALCTYGLTIFPTPLIGYSIWHRVFAIGSFFLSAAWPVFAMRRGAGVPMVLRPACSVIATVLQLVLAVGFLAVWTSPEFVNVGVWERVVALSQSAYMSFVILYCYLSQRKTTNR